MFEFVLELLRAPFLFGGTFSLVYSHRESIQNTIQIELIISSTHKKISTSHFMLPLSLSLEP